MNYVLAPMYLCSAGLWILNRQGLETKKMFIQGGLVNKGGHLVLNPGMPAPTSRPLSSNPGAAVYNVGGTIHLLVSASHSSIV